MADRRQHFLLLSQIFHFLYILLLQKFFLLSSLDYIWCATAMQLDTLKLDTLKTLLLGYSTFCYCTRPEFKSTAEFFLLKKLHQQIYTATLLLPRKTIIFKVLFTECVHFTAIPSSSCFFFLLLLLSHTTILCVDSKELGQYFGSIQYCLAARLMKYLTLED